ncbi:MAG: hypothetical protein FJ303_02345 [Planctomycetes bacterium]|nr:hypothetical protein [Planctomycetota bacterium]
MSARWLCTLGLFAFIIPTASAQDPRSPLRFVPKQAEAIVYVQKPRDLVDAVLKNEVFLQAQKLAGVRDLYDSTNTRQFYQLLAYLEKQLDQNRYDLLDELTSGVVVLGAKLTQPGGAVLVIQANDEKKLRRFLDVAFDIVQKELERQESKDKLERSMRDGVEVGQVGPKVRFAIMDGAFLIASDDAVLKLALEAPSKKTSVMHNPRFVDAIKKTAGKPLAWGWINLDEVRSNNPEFKNGLDAAGLDPFQMLLFGGFADLLKRTPYVAASVNRETAGGYRIGIAMPVGANGMAPVKHMILPADKAGTMTPLQPPRVISSSSYFLDLGELWEKRVEILGAKNAAGLDEGDKNLAKFLGGIKLAKLFKAMGPHHRLVFAQQKERPYKVKPAAPFPAVALVVDMRDQTFAKDMNSIFRAAALLATFQVGLTLKEEKYKGCDLVSYYFSETKKFDGDPTGIRFNFSPTYVTVGNQFVMSGTAELARDLIDLLQAERIQQASPASMQTRFYSSGLGEIIRMNQDQTLTQLILSYALPPKTAAEELRRILDWVDQLGTLRLESTYGANDFRYDVFWQPKKR